MARPTRDLSTRLARTRGHLACQVVTWELDGGTQVGYHDFEVVTNDYKIEDTGRRLQWRRPLRHPVAARQRAAHHLGDRWRLDHRLPRLPGRRSGLAGAAVGARIEELASPKAAICRSEKTRRSAPVARDSLERAGQLPAILAERAALNLAVIRGRRSSANSYCGWVGADGFAASGCRAIRGDHRPQIALRYWPASGPFGAGCQLIGTE